METRGKMGRGTKKGTGDELPMLHAPCPNFNINTLIKYSINIYLRQILLDNRVFEQHVNRIIEHRGYKHQDEANLLKEK